MVGVFRWMERDAPTWQSISVSLPEVIFWMFTLQGKQVDFLVNPFRWDYRNSLNKKGTDLGWNQFNTWAKLWVSRTTVVISSPPSVMSSCLVKSMPYLMCEPKGGDQRSRMWTSSGVVSDWRRILRLQWKTGSSGGPTFYPVTDDQMSTCTQNQIS